GPAAVYAAESESSARLSQEDSGGAGDARRTRSGPGHSRGPAQGGFKRSRSASFTRDARAGIRRSAPGKSRDRAAQRADEDDAVECYSAFQSGTRLHGAYGSAEFGIGAGAIGNRAQNG